MTGDNRLSDVKNKAQVFFEKQIFIFVKVIKSNGGYELRNGIIKELSALFFIIIDYKTNQRVPIFFSELINEGSIFEPSREERK